MYKIVKDGTRGYQSEVFEKEIEKLQKEGWVCQGGVMSTTTVKGDVFWAQAMVKEGAAPEEKKSAKKK